ncbi:MAG TPA: hypothetical protein VF838_02135 [Trebonia sp.]
MRPILANTLLPSVLPSRVVASLTPGTGVPDPAPSATSPRDTAAPAGPGQWGLDRLPHVGLTVDPSGLEPHDVVDLLPDRQAEARWLVTGPNRGQ